MSFSAGAKANHYGVRKCYYANSNVIQISTEANKHGPAITIMTVLWWGVLRLNLNYVKILTSRMIGEVNVANSAPVKAAHTSGASTTNYVPT